MHHHKIAFLAATAGLLLVSREASASPTMTVDPRALRPIGTVDERYQSYNIEMIEVVGGRWWAPYSAGGAVNTAASAAPTPSASGISPSAMRARKPIDLADGRLRKLAAALSPVYVRVSDTWANTLYFQDTDDSVARPAPAGFGAVLTRPQWKGVIDFSNALDARIVTSFSIGTGVRDASGVWTPSEAKKLLAYTSRAGGRIAAAEFFNEPNMAVIEGAPKGYDAAQYGRDFRIFRSFIRAEAPSLLLLGPGPVGERRGFANFPGAIRTEDMLKAEGPGLDAVSYHYYGAFSKRCLSMGAQFQTTPEDALTPQWLSATADDADFYGNLRDRSEPGAALWLSETAQAACGGDPWAATFADSFRYLNQLGLLAKHGVSVTMHNTLIGSDYGLIDDRSYVPRPNYWAAVLWRRLMGTKVLDAGVAKSSNLYLYAASLRGDPGGITLLVINADRQHEVTFRIPEKSRRYRLSAPDLLSTQVDLNGTALKVSKDGNLPAIQGVGTRGSTELPPESITFFTISSATLHAISPSKQQVGGTAE